MRDIEWTSAVSGEAEVVMQAENLRAGRMGIRVGDILAYKKTIFNTPEGSRGI
jgi:hypothetical protein